MEIIKIVTEDKLHLTGFLSEPSQKTGRIIVHIHGMSGSPYENDWYSHFHRLYPENGYAFLVGQLRGTGSMTMFYREPDQYPTIGNALEIFEESGFDIDAWVNYARSLGYTEIILQAHSFGPSKVVYYLSLKPAEDIKALALISPVDMLGLTMVDSNYGAMVGEAKELMSQGKPTQLLSKLIDGDYYVSAQTFINLFSPESKANVFCFTDRPHDWSLVNTINVPVLLLGGTKDGPIESVTKTENALRILTSQLQKSPRTDTKIFESATHDFSGFEKQIVESVTSFYQAEI